MPENPTAEDPFADLYGKLPDPRAREAVTGQDVPSQPTSHAPVQRQGSSTPPLSRRAMRAGGGQDAVNVPAEDRRVVETPKASLEDLFTGQASTDALGSPPPPPDRRKRRIGGWIALGVVLVLVGGIAGGGVWAWNTYQDRIRAFMGSEEPTDYEAGIAGGDVTVTIASGDNGQMISASLFQAGVTKTSSAFYDMLVKSGQNPTFYPGAYQLQKKMTAAAALTALQDPANKLENTVQLREGLTVAQMLPIISEGLGLSLDDLKEAVADPSQYGVSADSLEGWLFPATYTFNPGLTAADVVKVMVDRATKSLDTAGVPEDDRQRVLTIASIIQREARYPDDFFKVSRVIENRLDPDNTQTFGYLQMDSTSVYGYVQSHDGQSPGSFADAKNDDNTWNTYAFAGLPSGPTGNPGDTAIDAAMHPADGPWLYFVTVDLDSGETLFTTNLADHDKTVQQLRDWCTAHPGHDGC